MNRVPVLPTPNRHQVTSFASDLSEEELARFHHPIWPIDRARIFMKTPDSLLVFEYAEEQPPLVLNAGMESMLVEMRCTRKHSLNPSIQTDWVPNAPGPFLAELEEGETQLAMVNPLFRAPVFCHETRRDFLLIKQPDGRFSMTPISTLFLCGQTEPQSICVPVPMEKVMKSQEMVLALGISRLLELNTETSTLTTMKDIRSAVLSPYSLQHRKWLRSKCNELIQRIGFCAVTVSEDGKDLEKDVRQYRFRGKTLRPYFRRDWLMANISPEMMCAEESSLAAEYRLRQVGITSYPSLDQITEWLSNMEKLRVFKEHRARVFCTSDTLIDFLVRDIVELDRRIETGRFILYQLQRAPWNTTSTFFVTQVEPDNKGVMSIDSGEVDEFTFVRFNAQQHATGDLRKMKTADARKLLKDGFKLPWEEIRLLNRWDLIHRVQDLSTQAMALSETMETSPLARFSRGVTTPRSYISKCNAIWKRQKTRLTATLDWHDEDDEDDDEEEEEEEDQKVAKIIQSIKSQPRDERRDLAEFRAILSGGGAPVASGHPQQQVVRRTVRTISENGTETVTFQFLFGENAMKFAMKHQKQKK